MERTKIPKLRNGSKGDQTTTPVVRVSRDFGCRESGPFTVIHRFYIVSGNCVDLIKMTVMFLNGPKATFLGKFLPLVTIAKADDMTGYE